MTEPRTKTMRDAVIERIYARMAEDRSIFFVSADFGAPALDRIRQDYPDHFVNVGIAEQNLVNVCTGLALEGLTVYGYAIATFLTMRAYEQIRNNISLMARHRQMNVNLLGVGAGLSYDMSGPSHHCLEDLSIMRTLPEIAIFSPGDWMMAEAFVDVSIGQKAPKYWRLDGKPVGSIYSDGVDVCWDKGFFELSTDGDVCLLATGCMTGRALEAADALRTDGIAVGIIDLFMLRPLDADALARALGSYHTVITIEEGFVGKGGLDSLISGILRASGSQTQLESLGFPEAHVFECNNRDALVELNGCGPQAIARAVTDCLMRSRR